MRSFGLRERGQPRFPFFCAVLLCNANGRPLTTGLRPDGWFLCFGCLAGSVLCAPFRAHEARSLSLVPCHSLCTCIVAYPIRGLAFPFTSLLLSAIESSHSPWSTTAPQKRQSAGSLTIAALIRGRSERKLSRRTSDKDLLLASETH